MNIQSELKKALVNSLLGKYSLYILQMASVAILARLFSPEVFGVVATAQVFVMFFQMLATSGLAPAIVFQESVSVAMRNGIFTFSLILGMILAFVFILLAKPLFEWFEFSQGQIVFYVLAPCVLFSSLSMIPMASLQKDAKFIVIARAEIFAESIALIACLIASNYWEPISALALKFMLVPILRFFFYYLSSGKTVIGRAIFGREISQVKTLYAYAKYQVAFNVLNFFASNVDNLLIAKFFGASSLGIYEKTYQVMRYPLQLFTFAITPALQPVFTKYKNNPQIIYNEYIGVTYKLALVGLLSSAAMYQNAHDIVFILFGDQWFEAVPFLQILAISIPIRMVLSSTGGVYQAFGETKSMFYCGAFSSVVTCLAIFWGILSESILVLCQALVVSYFINFLQCFYVLYRSVFIGQRIKKFAILCLVLSLGLLNLLFEVNTDIASLSYYGSFLNITKTSIITSIPLIFIFLLLRTKRVKK